MIFDRNIHTTATIIQVSSYSLRNKKKWFPPLNSFLPWILAALQLPKKNSFRGNYLRKYGMYTYVIHTYLLLKWKKGKKINRYCFISCKLDQANWFSSAATPVIVIFATIIQGWKLSYTYKKWKKTIVSSLEYFPPLNTFRTKTFKKE